MSTHCHSNRRHNQKICHFGVVRLFTTVAAAAVTTWWRTYARRWYEGGRLGGCRQHLHKTFSILIECSQLSSLFLSSLPSCCYKKNTKTSTKKRFFLFFFCLFSWEGVESCTDAFVVTAEHTGSTLYKVFSRVRRRAHFFFLLRNAPATTTTHTKKNRRRVAGSQKMNDPPTAADGPDAFGHVRHADLAVKVRI